MNVSIYTFFITFHFDGIISFYFFLKNYIFVTIASRFFFGLLRTSKLHALFLLLDSAMIDFVQIVVTEEVSSPCVSSSVRLKWSSPRRTTHQRACHPDSDLNAPTPRFTDTQPSLIFDTPDCESLLISIRHGPIMKLIISFLAIYKHSTSILYHIIYVSSP